MQTAPKSIPKPCGQKTSPLLYRWLPCLLIFCLLASGCSRNARKARHLARGEKFFKAEQYDKAEIEFLNVLRLDPTNAVATRQLGLGFHQQGRLGAAHVFLQKAVQLDPRNDQVHLRLAGILVASGKLKEARAHADAVLSHDPLQEEALTVLADTAVFTNEIAEVRQRLASLGARAESAVGFHIASGMLDLRQRHTNEALAHFQRALSLDPRSSSAHLAMANGSALLEDNAATDLYFKKSVELAPVRSGRAVQYADYKLIRGDLAAAKTLLNSITKKAPDYVPPYTRLGEIALTERRFDEADSFCKKVLVRDPGNYDAMLLLGRISLARGEPAKAVVHFERLAAAYPRLPNAHYRLAVAYVLNRNQPKAMASLRQALALDPRHTESIILLAELNIRNSDFGPAVSSLKQLIKEQPHVTQAYLLLANAYRSQRQFDAAVPVYESMTRLFPRNPQPYLLWGQTLLSLQNKDAARRKFEKASEIAPPFLAPLEELVDLDIGDGQFATAEKRIQERLEKFPNASALFILLGKTYTAQKDYPKAEAALSRAIALEPDSQPAYIALARAYVASNNHREALRRLNTVLAKSPNDSTALMLQGMVQAELKEYAAAAASYEKLLTTNPQSIPALNNLAYLYSERLDRLPRAYEIARTARDLQPVNPFVADTLGWILFKRGDYPGALNLLQESAERVPNNAEILFHLGMTHYMLSEEASARATFDRALQSNQEFAGRTEARQKLALLSSSAPQTTAALEKELAANPRDPIILTRLASLYEQSGAAEQAVKAYQQVLQSNPRNVSAILKAAQLYAGPLHQPARAIQLARDAHELAPEDPVIGHTLGRLAFDAGDYKWSFSLLQESARRLPDNPDVLYDLAWASYSAGRLSEADSLIRKAVNTRKQFDRSADAKRFIELNTLALKPDEIGASVPQADLALKQDPEYVPALFASAVANERSGHAGSARSAYDLILKRFPDFAPAHKRLAALLSSSPSDEEAAFQHATKARAALPDDPEVARTLGMLALQRKDYSRAARLLKEASTKRPQDAEIFFSLGTAHFHANEKSQSRQALQQALSLRSDAPFAAEAQRMLAQLK
jgi:tetratricopeptide (TPR) repeat protein